MAPETTSMAEAIESLEAALCTSDSPRTFAPLAEAYRLAGRLDEALRTAERGVAAFPGHVGISVVMARILTDLNDFERAREAYIHVLRLDPGNLEALSLAGPITEPVDGCTASGDESAQRRAETAEGLEDGSPGSAATLREELAHLDDLFVSPAYESDSGSEAQEPAGIATLTLAEIYSRQGLRDEAVRVCKRILERHPEDEDARRALDAYLSQPSSV